jgi:hypothetical protein
MAANGLRALENELFMRVNVRVTAIIIVEG